jgi:hypothetical protein
VKLTVGQLKQIIREADEREQLKEFFGSKKGSSFGAVLDDILKDLYDTNKKVEKAHELAPAGPAKAIVMGLHSDLFNKVAEFRKYVEELKKLAGGAKVASEGRKPGSRH